MITNLFVVLFILLMAYWWGSVQGFFSAFIHLIMTVLAGTLAFALWEPLTVGLLMGIIPTYSWGVGLLAPFGIFLLILRVTGDKLVKANLQFSQLVNTLSGGACGLLAGMLTAGMIVIGVGFLPIDSDAWGYQPLVVEPNGQVADNPSGDLWIPVDQYAATFFSKLSGGSFYTRSPLRLYQPDLATQAALFRLRYDPNASVVASPDAVTAPNQYSLPLPVPEIPDVIMEGLGSQARVPRTKIVVVETVWKMRAGTYDGDNTLRVPPTQVRLLAIERTPGRTTAQLHAPVGVTTFDPTANQRRFKPFNSPKESAYGLSQEERLTWTFLIPEAQDADFILVRHLRLKLPKAKTDSAALASAIGRAGAASKAKYVDGVDPETGNEPALAVHVTDKLPNFISKNLASGLTYTGKDNLILSGYAQVRRPASRIGKGARAERIHAPKHLAVIRMQFAADDARSLLGAVVASAEMLSGVWLEDDRDDKWYPIGYVWQMKGGIQRISIDRDNPIRSIKQLPVGEMRTGDKLFLYFVVRKGVTITRAHYGKNATQKLKIEIPS